MAAVASALFELQPSRFKVQIIVYDNQGLRRPVVPAKEKGRGFSAPVHKGLRLGKDHGDTEDFPLAYDSLTGFPPEADPLRFGQCVYDLKSDIVPMVLVLPSRISEPYNDA